MNGIRKERFRQFFIFFKGGGVLTIFFLFEQLSDNQNQRKIKNERKVVHEYTFLKLGQFKTNLFYLSVHGKSYTKPKKNSKMRNISSWSFQSFLFEWQFTGSLTN